MPLVVSILCGFAAVALFQLYLKDEMKKNDEGMALVPVTVANRDLSAGTILQEEYIAKKEIPKKYLEDKEILYSDLTEIIGQPLRYPVKGGEVLLWTGVNGQKENSLAARLPSGRRALALGVDEVTSVSGLIQPGDHVDILGTFSGDSALKESKHPPFLGEATVMVLQNVLVLATGTQLRHRPNAPPEEGSGYAAITVSVTPEEAGLLVLSENRGRLTMILRKERDSEVVADLPRVTYDDVRLGKNLHNLTRERNSKVIDLSQADRNRKEPGTP